MLNCRELVERADPFVDGELKGWPLIQVKLHLMMCANCREFVSQVGQTKTLVRRSVEAARSTVVDDILMSAFKNQNPRKDPTQ